MLKSFQSNFICYSAIFKNSNFSAVRKLFFFISKSEIPFAFKNQERRDSPALWIDCLNYYNPFSITRLNQFKFSYTIWVSYYNSSFKNTHQKPGFVKVVYILDVYSKFGYKIDYKSKSISNYFWIFTQSPLIVIQMCFFLYLELWLSLYKVFSPILFNWWYITFAI